MDQTAVAAALGVSVLALWSLSGNAQFPTPVSNDGAGIVVYPHPLPRRPAANGWDVMVMSYRDGGLGDDGRGPRPSCCLVDEKGSEG